LRFAQGKELTSCEWEYRPLIVVCQGHSRSLDTRAIAYRKRERDPSFSQYRIEVPIVCQILLPQLSGCRGLDDFMQSPPACHPLALNMLRLALY